MTQVDTKQVSSGRLLVKGMSGLGNRVLSLLTASLFAMASGRRLLVDWRDAIFTGGRSESAPDLFADLFFSPLVDPLPEIIMARSIVPPLWRDRLNETVAVVGRDHNPNFYCQFWSFRDLAVNLRRLNYKEDMLVFWSWREVLRPLRPHLIRIDERYRAMSDLAILREAAEKYLQPSERIRKIVDAFASEHFTHRMLGLHIRATDLRAPVKKLLRKASRIIEQNKCDGVFCATDNAEVEALVRRTLPNVVTLPKQFPKDAIALHYNPDCLNRLELATQALADMLLLSRCNCLTYASRSTFGYVARIYARASQVAVDVDRYNPHLQAKRFIQSWTY